MNSAHVSVSPGPCAALCLACRSLLPQKFHESRWKGALKTVVEYSILSGNEVGLVMFCPTQTICYAEMVMVMVMVLVACAVRFALSAARFAPVVPRTLVGTILTLLPRKSS